LIVILIRERGDQHGRQKTGHEKVPNNACTVRLKPPVHASVRQRGKQLC
jgi:hypothetical protein